MTAELQTLIDAANARLEVESHACDDPKCDVCQRIKALRDAVENTRPAQDSTGKVLLDAETVDALRKDKARLDALINLTNDDGKDGWQVSLNYDNYQDGARVIDSDGNILGECYDVEKEPYDQFIAAIAAAMKENP